MPTDRDEDTGQFTEEYPLEAFTSALSDFEMATTSEVAESVGCSYDLAYRRLMSLEEEGVLEKDRVGNSYVWTLRE